MVRTFSTLFQTMMRCYSSLRAGRGHIYFPNPVQQVIPKDSHGLSYMKHFDSKWTKTWVENRAGNLTKWDGHSRGKKLN